MNRPLPIEPPLPPLNVADDNILIVSNEGRSPSCSGQPLHEDSPSSFRSFYDMVEHGQMTAEGNGSHFEKLNKILDHVSPEARLRVIGLLNEYGWKADDPAVLTSVLIGHVHSAAETIPDRIAKSSEAATAAVSEQMNDAVEKVRSDVESIRQPLEKLLQC